MREAYKIVENIIEGFDDLALKELVSGNTQDLNLILETLISEAKGIVSAQNKLFDPGSFGYLDKFTESVEMTLRCRSLNYFILACLPSFILEPYSLEWSNMVQMHKYLNILCARGHSKSYFFSFALPIWQMYKFKQGKGIPWEFELGKWGVIVTNEQGLANSFVKLIKQEIESNDLLGQVLLPDNRNIGWGAEELNARNGSRITAKSYGAKIRGMHPTYFVLDDYLAENVLYSLDQREKYMEVFSGSIFPAVLPGGQIFVVGTPFSSGDLYANLRDFKDPNTGEILFKQLKYPAIYPDGRLLSPSRFTYESLMAQRGILGNMRFSREILVTPINDGSSIFPMTDLDNATVGQDQFTLISRIENSSRKFEKVTVGVDFAISANIGADFFAVIVLGIDAVGHYHLLCAVIKRGLGYDDQISTLEQINRDFRPDVINVENNGFQKIYEDELKKRGLPVIGRTTNSDNKKSLQYGLPSIAVLFQTSKIHFATGNAQSLEIANRIKSELNSITFIPEKNKMESVGEHDDTCMALFFAIEADRITSHNFDFSFV